MSNGATTQQQERIFRNRQEFAELVQQLQAQIDFDQDEQVNSEVRKIYCTDDN